MYRYWTEDTPEARNFSTILVGLLSESTQGAADPNELLRIADKTLRIYTPEDGGDTHINIDNWSQVVPVMADWLRTKLQ